MGFIDTILYPIKWVVAWIMVGAHNGLTALGLDPAGGWSWLLSIVVLVVVLRVILIPLFMRQIRATRGMQIVQPEIQKLQKKYKGKTDPASRQAQQQEMMAIYKDAGTSPFASCLPLLAQMPIFFSLYRVLIALTPLAEGSYARDSIGPLDQALAAQAESSEIFGASLSSTFLKSDEIAVKIVAGVLVIVMSAVSLFTQRQLTMKNMSQAALDNPMAKQQRMLMYLMPLMFVFMGLNFPIGVLVYWTTSNTWSMGQQWLMIHNAPAPGSEAEKEYKERQARKAARHPAKVKASGLEDDVASITTLSEKPQSGQRQQPKRKGKGSTKPGTTTGLATGGDDADSRAGSN